MNDVRVLLNRKTEPSTASDLASRAPLGFHRRFPGYAPTPLVDAPGLARSLGVGRVWVKDESSRFGLPAFKIMGASWAVYRALEGRLPGGIGPWEDLDELRDGLASLRPLFLAAATDGNHGRAVARMASLLGFESRIFVPDDMVAARRRAIESEGAAVTVVEGGYDAAVARAAREEGEDCLVISDTAWPGYEEVPRRVIEGYASILWEVTDELRRREEPDPTLVVAQIGVGAFAAAVAAHYRRPGLSPQPALLGVEPLNAACLLHSIEAGEMVSLSGPVTSIMAGLNCGTPSPVAWPTLSSHIDAFVAVDDAWSRRAMRALAASDIVSGETGASGLAGLMALLRSDEAGEARAALGIDGETRALIFSTEGATDPESYERILAS